MKLKKFYCAGRKLRQLYSSTSYTIGKREAGQKYFFVTDWVGSLFGLNDNHMTTVHVFVSAPAELVTFLDDLIMVCYTILF